MYSIEERDNIIFIHCECILFNMIECNNNNIDCSLLLFELGQIVNTSSTSSVVRSEIYYIMHIP